MYHFPIRYDEPVFRPPAEAASLILQLTLGCSWNACAFCEMYTSKHFRVRPQEEVFRDIESFAPYASQVRKIFLADGDPLVLSTTKLLPILRKIRATFPRLKRISAYASPGNLANKSVEELKELKENGLSLLYAGIESGDDTVLQMVNKGESFDTTVKALNKAHEAGMHSSVMIITGLGGQVYSQQHALNSARLLNATQPRYVSTLVLSHYKGIEHFRTRFQGDFTEMTLREELQEMKWLMEALELSESIFRSDHVSNHLVLKGVLGKDKQRLLQEIKLALQSFAT